MQEKEWTSVVQAPGGHIKKAACRNSLKRRGFGKWNSVLLKKHKLPEIDLVEVNIEEPAPLEASPENIAQYRI